jgi:hypothetical protein
MTRERRETPVRDRVRATAARLGASVRDVFERMSPADREAVAWELFANAQAEVDAGRMEGLDEEISRHLDRGQVDAILASVPSDTSVVLHMPRVS